MDAKERAEKKAIRDEAAQNKLYQQQLKSFRPLVTPMCTSIIFAIAALVCLLFGGLIVGASDNIVEQEVRYDNQCQMGQSCTIGITIEKEMKAPVYFYYKLVNFYQNHRSYVQDYSKPQLQGKATDTTGCSVKEVAKRDGKPVFPCGLIANSFFNDVFSLKRVGGTTFTGDDWDGSDLTWSSDKEKFKNKTFIPDTVVRTSTRGNTLPLPTTQDFEVWFRVAGLPRFNKLYRKIGTTTLQKGEKYEITIDNQFEVGKFGGEKWVLLSTTSWIGGANHFLGYLYIITGTMCAIYSMGMLIKQARCPRRKGEMRYYGWTGYPTQTSG